MISCIAIDDEPLALGQIAEYIQKTPFLKLEGLFDSALQAYEALAATSVDVMFVDINMPDLNGMDFVKTLENPPRIVFVTAYSQYAVEGFRIDALDYLLKPVSYTDFLKSANKVMNWFNTHHQNTSQTSSNKDFLFIKSEYKLIRINFNEIKYLEGMNEYIRIHLTNSKPVMTLLSMKVIESLLPSDRFMRVHRSYIVNLSKITTIDRKRIVFDGKVYIPVSEQYDKKFQGYISENF